MMGAAFLMAQTAKPAVTLEPSGMVVMGISIAIVCGLSLFCVVHLLREKDPGKHHHVPLDIDPGDVDR